MTTKENRKKKKEEVPTKRVLYWGFTVHLRWRLAASNPKALVLGNKQEEKKQMDTSKKN